MSKLFKPIRLGKVDIRNRIIMAPMCIYSAAADGLVTDWHLAHYAARAVGGAGLLILEATGIEPRGRISERDLGLWSDEQIPGLRRITDIVRGAGAAAGVQLAHAGRKAQTSEEAVAPSALSFDPDDTGYKVPEELDAEGVKQTVEKFASAARRADEAGFDLIEIHAAHGYLISEFLSPISNKRTDKYGGELEDRCCFLAEVLEAVRAVWPKDKAISVRISAVNHINGGITMDDTIRMIELLKDTGGVDIWHVSSGGISPNDMPSGHPSYQVPYSEEIKKRTDVTTAAVGLVTTAELAEEIVSNKRADMVALGRELLRNPYWPLKAAEELKAEIDYWPSQYLAAKG